MSAGNIVNASTNTVPRFYLDGKTWRDFAHRKGHDVANELMARQDEDVMSGKYTMKELASQDKKIQEILRELEFQQRNDPNVPKPRPAKNPYNENHENTYRFYEDIVPEIRKRELGVDKLSDRDGYALSDTRNVIVKAGLPDGATNIKGYCEYGIPWISRPIIYDSTGGKNPGILPHELKHHVASKGLKLTDDSYNRLQNEYEFVNNPKMSEFYALLPQNIRDDMLAEEMRTTNTELQFQVYSDLMKKLGRNPTAEEYFKYIDDMPDGDVVKLRKHYVNGYDAYARQGQGKWRPPAEGSSGERERADQIRYLLKSVTRNNQHNKKYPMGTRGEINSMVKKAAPAAGPQREQNRLKYISKDWSTFTLPKGKTLSHVVNEYNSIFPHAKTTWQALSRANGGLSPEKFQAGKAYKMPYSPFSPGFLNLIEMVMAEAKRHGIDVTSPGSGASAAHAQPVKK